MSRLHVLGARTFMVATLACGILCTALPGDAQQRVTKNAALAQVGTNAPGRAQQKGQAQSSIAHASHMHAALHELKEARHELHDAKHDFGGHREKALEAVDHAINQLEKAVKFHHPSK